MSIETTLPTTAQYHHLACPTTVQLCPLLLCSEPFMAPQCPQMKLLLFWVFDTPMICPKFPQSLSPVFSFTSPEAASKPSAKSIYGEFMGKETPGQGKRSEVKKN